MIVDTEGRILKARNVWFEQVSSLDDIPKGGTDIVYIYGNSQPLSGSNVICHKQYSAITDLTLCRDDIFSSFASNLRNEIRRAKREEVMVRFCIGDDAIEQLPEFAETFRHLYEEKGEKEELPVKEMKTFAEENALMISAASVSGEAKVFHSYIYDGNSCRLTFSCSEFRAASSKEEKQAFARANKLLHWEDMLYFIDKGLSVYDWGGLTSPEEPNGIDKFKLSFGCKPVEYYNIIKPITMKAMLVREIKNQITKRS